MATKYWNTGSGDWTNAANWTPAGVPGAGEQAAFDTGSSQSYTVTGTGSSNSLAVIDQIDLAGRLTIGNGFWLQDSVTVPAGQALRWAARSRRRSAGHWIFLGT